MSTSQKYGYSQFFQARLFRREDHELDGTFYVIPLNGDYPAYLHPDGSIRKIANTEDSCGYYRTEAEIESAYRRWIEEQNED